MRKQEEIKSLESRIYSAIDYWSREIEPWWEQLCKTRRVDPDALLNRLGYRTDVILAALEVLNGSDES